MKTKSRFKIDIASRAGVLSSLLALTFAGNASGQDPLVLDHLELLRPPGEVCTITFGADQGQQIIARSSSDLECWVFAGVCDEITPCHYQFVDLGAVELPGQFYQFECFNPEIPLPPQFEQLRLELGDEEFSQWLASNVEQFGTLQGISTEQVEEFDESSQEQFQEIEDTLDFWLKDFHNAADPMILPELVLPTEFEEIRLDWGDYDFTQLLVENLDQWGNLQGLCEPLITYWEDHEPLLLVEFQNEEQVLELWLESYLIELPPIILENFEAQEAPLPPQLEQLRLELGDEAFAEWLRSNRQEVGNLQGFPEGDLPEDGPVREQFEAMEADLERWLSEFENPRPR